MARAEGRSKKEEARRKKQEGRCNHCPEFPDRIDFFLIRSSSAI
ncbi:MAG: hypothetical protein U7126_11780 [Microcoleus sp.]